MTPGLPWWHGANRTGGTLPIADHLRPAPVRVAMSDCPIYSRLTRPADRASWRHYDLSDLLPVTDAIALPVAGEA